jgi:hypothetical protein
MMQRNRLRILNEAMAAGVIRMKCAMAAYAGLVGLTTVLALSACAQLAEPKPTNQTAVVRSGPWGKVYRGGDVEIASVDGIKPQWRVHSAMQIPEGERSAWFYVYLCTEDPKSCISIAQANVAFHAQGGHTYRACAQEQVNGSNRFWVWVEDEGSGQVVGGTPPNGQKS